MFVLRCTKKLLQHMAGSAVLGADPPKSTTKLGDWTANLVVIRRQQLVLAVSDLTLLPVILPLAPSRTLLARLPEAVGQVLVALGIDGQKVASEASAMGECIVASTIDRRVVGSMNEFALMLEAYLDGRRLVDVALHLAEAPCSPIGMERPKDVARSLLSAPALRLVKG